MSNYSVDMDGCITISRGETYYDIVRYLICGKFRSVRYGDNYGYFGISKGRVREMFVRRICEMRYLYKYLLILFHIAFLLSPIVYIK